MTLHTKLIVDMIFVDGNRFYSYSYDGLVVEYVFDESALKFIPLK